MTICLKIKKTKYRDFACQFGPECITWEPNERTCEKHGPIKWVREDFGNCKECHLKWKQGFLPKNKIK